jgi:hypothetical protein
MVARLASITKWHQKVAGSSPAVVILFFSTFLARDRVSDASSTFIMTKVLSDHLSNPLQATASDVTNNAYNRIYNQAKQRPVFVLSSEDELGQWSGQENYQQQVKSVQARFKQFSTPKHVDLDEDMSEDELAQPFKENTSGSTIDPRREFHTPKRPGTLS